MSVFKEIEEECRVILDKLSRLLEKKLKDDAVCSSVSCVVQVICALKLYKFMLPLSLDCVTRDV